jgi:hypothetical protein
MTLQWWAFYSPVFIALLKSKRGCYLTHSIQPGNVPEFMSSVGIMASKTYTRGLVLISIYYENTIYFVMQPGEGDQALLDVRFPDVSRHGQGMFT